jgi:mono/diheme cytochrome c family protein
MRMVPKRTACTPRRAAALVAVAGCILFPGVIVGQTGEELFEEWCVDCHTVGGGELVGPDLAGVSERRSIEWLIAIVQNSEALIEAGDPDAVALYEEYEEMAMPELPLSDAEVMAVIEYTKRAATGGEAAAAIPPPTEPPPTAEAIVRGQDFFQGTARLANGGAACNACHDVKNDAVVGGGTLSKDLTDAYSRIGGPGVRSILGRPPFPVMRAAYEDRSLTDDEVDALAAFLHHADSEGALEPSTDYGVTLAVSGVVGTAVLLVLYSLFWRRRKRDSVYQSIYDRQIRST